MKSGITCVDCEEDADVEIVKAAMAIALEKSVCVLADDADITVLLIHKIFERLSSGLSIHQLRVGVELCMTWLLSQMYYPLL